MRNRHALVLDRFLPLDGDRALDLASGEPVLLRRPGPVGDRAQRCRADAAALVWPLRIPGVAALVDYGVDGGRAWTEAYASGECPADVHTGQGRPVAARTIAALLKRAGCAIRSDGQESRGSTTRDGLFVPAPWDRVVPAETFPADHAQIERAGGPAAGTIIQRRDEMEPVMDRISGAGEAGARMVGIAAPADAGLRTFFTWLAREARLAGFVPVSSRLFGPAFAWPQGIGSAALGAALQHRHLVILDEPDDCRPSPRGEGIVRFLSRLDTTGGRPHAIVSAGPQTDDEAAVPLAPMRIEQLCRSVLFTGIDEERAASLIREAAERSGGRPGLFDALVRAMLGLRTTERPYRPPRSSAVAVREAAPQRDGPITPGASPSRECRLLIARADQLVRRGRHAAAERLLRRTVGYLHRRRRTLEASRAQLALGRLLLARGRGSAARHAFEECRRLSDDAHDAGGVIGALVHLGSALVDEGDLPAAESVLRTARVGAGRAAFEGLARAADLQLARCLFWEGKHDQSWDLVQRSTRDATCACEPASAVAERCEPQLEPGTWGRRSAEPGDLPSLPAAGTEIGVRVALARNDAGLASRRLAAAGDPDPEQDPLQAGRLMSLRVLVHGALGEVEAITRTTAAGLDLMRRCHAPLAAQELRLAQLEALITAGARAEAAACARRLTAMGSRALPGLARQRLGALSARLQAPDGPRPQSASAGDTTIDAQAILQILQHCHESSCEADAIAGVCQTVRPVVGASAVSAFALVDGAARLVATSGQRACRPEPAERSALSLLVIGPERSAAGVELAAPVRYGGTGIGAMAARWPPGTTADEGRARGVLVAAAAAIGPAMAALGTSAPGKKEEVCNPGDLGGPSDAMAEVRRQISRAAAAPFPVLITGESGTGKELIAKAIHSGSARRARRFCAVNCAALSDDLFDSELFGHARGSFTGAATDRAGLFEDADGGTLFLDEVGELSPRAQAKLLRAIQEGEIRRVGENHSRRVDVRIVAATNRSLGEEVRAGRFRHDLLYRIDVIRLAVPPLRDRPEDIPPLARGFWRDTMQRIGGQAELSPATLAALARYDWPGNVRELQNALAALAVHAPRRGPVGPARLPAAIAGAGARTHGEPVTLSEARRKFDERFVRATLARTGGQRSAAASALGLSRQGLAKLIARLGLDGESRDASSASY